MHHHRAAKGLGSLVQLLLHSVGGVEADRLVDTVSVHLVPSNRGGHASPQATPASLQARVCTKVSSLLVTDAIHETGQDLAAQLRAK